MELIRVVLIALNLIVVLMYIAVGLRMFVKEKDCFSGMVFSVLGIISASNVAYILSV